MDSSKLAVKFFLHDSQKFDAHQIVPLFHSWIQTHAIADHLLLDVADYGHVESGPGTVLVAHEANYATDAAANRPGLLYTRKQPIPGDLAARIRFTIKAALTAAALLEGSDKLKSKLAFRTDTFEFRIHDRLLAPNNIETFQAVAPALQAVVDSMFGTGCKLTHKPSGQTVFMVEVSGGKMCKIGEIV